MNAETTNLNLEGTEMKSKPDYLFYLLLSLALLFLVAAVSYLVGVTHGSNLKTEESKVSTSSSSSLSSSSITSSSSSTTTKVAREECTLDVGIKLTIEQSWKCITNNPDVAGGTSQGYVDGDGISIYFTTPAEPVTKAVNGIKVEAYYQRGVINVFHVSTPETGSPDWLEGFVANEDIRIYVVYTPNNKNAPNVIQESQIKAILDSIELI